MRMKKAGALALTLVMLLGLWSTPVYAAEDAQAVQPVGTITAIEAPGAITAPVGTAQADLPLPAELAATATVQSGNEAGQEQPATLPVEGWACQDYDAATAGAYTFTPALSALPFPLGEGVSAPTLTVTLEAEETKAPPLPQEEAGAAAAAEEETAVPADPIIMVDGQTYTLEGDEANSLNVPGNATVTINGNGHTLNGLLTIWNNAHVTINNLNIVMQGTTKAAIRAAGTGSTLTFNGSNTMTGVTDSTPGSSDCQATVAVGLGAELTLEGTGTLTVTTERAGAAIGSAEPSAGKEIRCGKITINSGTITARSENGAAIGGGANIEGGTVIINGGTVYAHSVNGAGIGGGINKPGSSTTINGGTVTAISDNGTGIGGGMGIGSDPNDHGSAIITGGSVNGSSGDVVSPFVSTGFATGDGTTPVYRAEVAAFTSGGQRMAEAQLSAIGNELTYLATTNAQGRAWPWLPAGTGYTLQAQLDEEQITETDVSVAAHDGNLLSLFGGLFRLEPGAANRLAAGASVTFASPSEGSYYYTLARPTAATPDIDTSGDGFTCLEGVNTITIDELDSGLWRIYIVAKDSDGNLSNEICMEIADYEDTEWPDDGSEIILEHESSITFSRNHLHSLTVPANATVRIDGNGHTLSGTLLLQTGSTVRIQDLNINMTGTLNAAIKVGGTGCTLTFSGSNNMRGIAAAYAATLAVPEGSSLTLDGDGTLDVMALYYGSAIGSDSVKNSGTITIAGGTITANSTIRVAIGSDLHDDVIITGGSVNGHDNSRPTPFRVSPKNGNNTEVYRLTATALDGTGQPIGDATVSAGTYTARTNAQGVAHMWLPAGTHSLAVATDTENFTVPSVPVADNDENTVILNDGSPVLAFKEAIRVGEKSAQVTFISNTEGAYFYKLVEAGAQPPTIDTDGPGTPLATGGNALRLAGLQGADAKDLYIVAKGAGDSQSSADFMIPIPAEGDEHWPAGGTTIELLDGDGVTFTRTHGLTLAVAPGATASINGGGFTLDGTLLLQGGSTAHITDLTITMTGQYNAAIEARGMGNTLYFYGSNTMPKHSHNRQATVAVPVGAGLTLAGPGALYVTASQQGAAIGGGHLTAAGTINITGGTIVARAGNAAAIGGGQGNGSSPFGAGGNVTISGGRVIAAKQLNATVINGAAIGGGSNAPDGGTLTVTGGWVTATSRGNKYYDIGPGSDTRHWSGSTVITGGSVVAGHNMIYGWENDVERYPLTVTVLDTDRTPVPGASITTAAYTHPAETDTDGTATLWLPAGAYTLSAGAMVEGSGVLGSTSGTMPATPNAVTIELESTATVVEFTALQIGGIADNTDSTGIAITFSQAVTGLEANDIILTNSCGAVTKGALTGEGTEWTLALQHVQAQGNITVQIEHFNGFFVETDPQTVTVHRYRPQPPAAPTASLITATSVTLNEIAGAEYSLGEYDPWQSSTLFDDLLPNTTYSFYARVSAGDGKAASYPSEPLEVTTQKAQLSGTVSVTGTHFSGELLQADTAALTTNPADADMGTLSYQWLRDGADIPGAETDTYTLAEADVDCVITLRVGAENCDGWVTSTGGPAVTARDAPAAPTITRSELVGNMLCLEWTPQVSDAHLPLSGYLLTMALNGEEVVSKPLDAAAVSWSTTLTRSGIYTLALYPHNAAGRGIAATAQLNCSLAGFIDEILLGQSHAMLAPGGSAGIICTVVVPSGIMTSQADLDYDVLSASVRADSYKSKFTINYDNGTLTVAADTQAQAGSYMLRVFPLGNASLYTECRLDVVDSFGEAPYEARSFTAASVAVALYQAQPGSIRLARNTKDSGSPWQLGGLPSNDLAFTGASAGLLNAVFALVPAGENTLQIVTKPNAELTTLTKASYKAGISVQGDERIAGQITLKLDKKLPALKAANHTINTYFASPHIVSFANLDITGGMVQSLRLIQSSDGKNYSAAKNRANTSVEKWARLSAGEDDALQTLTVTDTTGKKSGTLYMMAELQGWQAEVPLRLNLTAKPTAPGLKLVASRATFYADAAKNSPVVLQLAATGKGESLDDFDVRDVTVATLATTAEQKKYPGNALFEAVSYNSANASFALKPREGAGTLKSGKVQLTLHFGDGTTHTLPLTVKVATGTVKLKLSRTSVSLNPDIQQLTTLSVLPSVGSYALDYSAISAPVWYESNGKSAVTDPAVLQALSAVVDADGTLTVAAGSRATPLPASVVGKTYKLKLCLPMLNVNAKGQSVNDSVTLTVKLLKNQSPKVALTVKGSVNLTTGDAATLTAKLSGCGAYLQRGGSYADDAVSLAIVDPTGARLTDQDVADNFEIERTTENSWSIRLKAGGALTTGTYKVGIAEGLLDDGMTQVVTEPKTSGNGTLPYGNYKALKVTATAPKLTRSASAVRLHSIDGYDEVIVTIAVPLGTAPITDVRLKGAQNSGMLYEVKYLGGGRVAIGFKEDSAPTLAKNTTKALTLEVMLQGNGDTSGSEMKAIATTRISVTAVA